MIGAVRRRMGEEGLTLIETLAALLVFSVITVGIFPLLASSMTAAFSSRTYTTGKTLAQQAMERVRGLPYHVSFGAKNTKVDLLDLYFPCANPSVPSPPCPAGGAAYSDGVFVTTCTGSSLNPACPRDIPAGFTLQFRASFVKPVGDATSQSYQIVLPPATYAWDSASGADLPPSQLIDMNISTQWEAVGSNKSFGLRSLIGDRQFGSLSFTAIGKVHYAVQVLGKFTDTDGHASELTIIGGAAESTVESRLVSQASQSVRAGQMTLVRVPDETSPEATDIARFEGASSSFHAPPDSSPLGATASSGTISHSELENAPEVAYVGETATNHVAVGVSNELPHAAGDFEYSNASSAPNLWLLNQADASSSSPLRLHPNPGVFSLRPQSGEALAGGTTATVSALGDGRMVETTARASFNDLRLMPTDFISGPNFERSVIVVNEFQASVSCTSTADGGTAEAVAGWSARLSYWVENDPNDGEAAGHYEIVDLSSSSGVDQLAAIKQTNPMVWEDPADTSPEGSPKDIYLFPVTHSHEVSGATVTHEHPGYLEDWTSSSSIVTNEDAEGRTTTADINGAIRIDTAPTNPAIANSGLNVSIGKLGCEAVDSR